jgi:hypothetical protein
MSEPEFEFAEVISPLMEMAIAMHETYTAFRTAGFDDDQSMQLIMNMADSGTMDEGDDD